MNVDEFFQLLTPEYLEGVTALDFEAVLMRWFEFSVTEEDETAFTLDLIAVLASINRPALLILYLETWKNHYSDQEFIPVEAKVLGYPLDDESLTLIVTAWDLDFYAIVSGLNLTEDVNAVTMAIANLQQLYPSDVSFDVTMLRGLRDKARESVNRLMVEYLEGLLHWEDQRLERLNNRAPVPSWIIPPPFYNSDGSLPTHNQLKAHVLRDYQNLNIGLYTSITPEKAVEVILKLKYGCGGEGMLTDNPQVYQQYLLDEFQRWKPQELLDYVNEIVRNTLLDYRMKRDGELFRVFGASHPIPGAIRLEVEDVDPCNLYAGCRHYLCYHNHNYDESLNREIYPDAAEKGQVKYINWRGDKTCDVCKKVVVKTCYSVRKPSLRGGWMGYYCSWVCVREDVAFDDDVTLHLIDEFEEDYRSQGIYDRA